MSAKKIVILGGGESGVGAAILAQKQGLEVFLSDKGPIKEHYKTVLEHHGIAFEAQQHSEDRILAADWVVKSPGIPKKAPLLEKIREKGITISSEIEFASHFTSAKIIAITGSNGKTTTTSLIYHLLKNAGLSVGLGGNIGQSFALQVATQNFEYYVIEVSSFQLDDIQSFRPYISLLLNLSPDHLDQYNYDYEAYALAKFRITENQEHSDYFIFNQDDEMSLKLLKTLDVKAKMVAFSLQQTLPEGGFANNDDLVLNWKESLSIPKEKIGIQGQHNMANALAAGLTAQLLSIESAKITQALGSFQAVEHRLEMVAKIDEVTYINDSKATNVNAAYYALESLKTPAVWLVGGVDKGNDYTEIEDLVRQKVHTVVCVGLDNQKLLDFFGPKVNAIFDCSSMAQAVKIAQAQAQAGDTVLLSPCCASFDLFDNYEHRGQCFKAEVGSLKP
jgi:UDP-N-acetylmuramoylalanine--D-glutamate ligase